MDKVICIQEGVNVYHPDRAHISRGEIYHVLDVVPHTLFKDVIKLSRFKNRNSVNFLIIFTSYK